jgi:cob(I)alamin adenosyltransferase
MAIQISKVTTKFGDRGDTSLSCGTTVPKYHPRVIFYGKLDSLNCVLGNLRTQLDLLPAHQQLKLQHPQVLIQIQNDLFDLGASYSFEKESEWQRDFPQAATEKLEEFMEFLLRDIEPLQSFVLPGGTLSNSLAHQSRSLTREIESWSVEHKDQLNLLPSGMSYLNRLSDLLFVLARACSKVENVEEYLWQAGLRKG